MPKKLFTVATILCLLGAGCGNTTTTTSSTAKEPDNSKQFTLSASEGGTVGLDITADSKVKIVFPQESLASDSSITLSPLTDSSDWLIPGFRLHKTGSTDGPEMDYPALIFFTIDKELGVNASIFRRDGSEEIAIPSKVSVKDGHTVVMAQVSHFSDYGVRDFKMDDKTDDQDMDDFNWVIYVKDSYDVDMGAMKRKVNLDFKAVNTSGDIAGRYNGYAHAKTSNDMEGNGGKIDADFQINDDNVSFEIGPYIELAPLVADDPNDPLAKLEPDKHPDLLGNGTLNMSGSGSGTVSAGGYSINKSLKATDSHDPFEINIFGPILRLTVTVNGIGTMYFDGYIRGEGK